MMKTTSLDPFGKMLRITMAANRLADASFMQKSIKIRKIVYDTKRQNKEARYSGGV
jgi:hypothetical protein